MLEEKNNCLFDAVCESYFGRKTDKTSAFLRKECNRVLEMKMKWPIIAWGEPAGEQYLQVLSYIFEVVIHVKKGDEMYKVAYNDKYKDKKKVYLEHLGNQDFGHWVKI